MRAQDPPFCAHFNYLSLLTQVTKSSCTFLFSFPRVCSKSPAHATLHFTIFYIKLQLVTLIIHKTSDRVIKHPSETISNNKISNAFYCDTWKLCVNGKICWSFQKHSFWRNYYERMMSESSFKITVLLMCESNVQESALDKMVSCESVSIHLQLRPLINVTKVIVHG